MKALVVYLKENDCIIYLEDGGVACVYPASCGVTTDLYQSRVTQPQRDFDLEEISEGKSYYNEYNSSTITDEILLDCCNWLAVGETFELEKVTNHSEIYTRFNQFLGLYFFFSC